MQLDTNRRVRGRPRPIFKFKAFLWCGDRTFHRGARAARAKIRNESSAENFGDTQRAEQSQRQNHQTPGRRQCGINRLCPSRLKLRYEGAADDHESRAQHSPEAKGCWFIPNMPNLSMTSDIRIFPVMSQAAKGPAPTLFTNTRPRPPRTRRRCRQAAPTTAYSERPRRSEALRRCVRLRPRDLVTRRATLSNAVGRHRHRAGASNRLSKR